MQIVHLNRFLSMLPLLDEFRTLNWTAIKRELEVSKIFEMFPMAALQN
jgi:hypothetical protein